MLLRHPTRRSWSTTGRDGGVTNFAWTGRNIVTSGTRYLTHRSLEGAMVIETDVNGPAHSGPGNGVGCGPRALPGLSHHAPLGPETQGQGKPKVGTKSESPISPMERAGVNCRRREEKGPFRVRARVR